MGMQPAVHGPQWHDSWDLRPGVTYLNHGSFGPMPRPVRDARRAWQAEIEAEPMDFFARRAEGLVHDVRARLARFVGCDTENLVLVDNATVAMNVVVANTRLDSGDQVLLTDHEYGAVSRMWARACAEGNAELVTAKLPFPLATVDEVLTALFAKVTKCTRIIIVSHITSPTAVILPVAAICQEARRLGIPVAVDGPHAPAMVPLDLREIDADYYCASCHKWLSAPLGTGFLYVHPRASVGFRAPYLSWGRLPPTVPQHWSDEFTWTGTRDLSGYLAIPAAIDFLEGVGLDRFRSETHELARYARGRLETLTGFEAFVPDDTAWYGSMIAVPLAPGRGQPLQDALWERHQIEVPIVEWNGRRHVRVSCHLYNDREQIDRLAIALEELLRSEL